MMKLVDFCRDVGVEPLQRKTRVFFEVFMEEKYMIITKTILTISYSKQSFEQEMSLSIFDDKNFKLKTYRKPPHGLRELFNITKD